MGARFSALPSIFGLKRPAHQFSQSFGPRKEDGLPAAPVVEPADQLILAVIDGVEHRLFFLRGHRRTVTVLR
jgi:hypothetical protein